MTSGRKRKGELMMRKPEFDVVVLHTVSLEGSPAMTFTLDDSKIQAFQVVNTAGIVIEAASGRSGILIPWHRVLECELKEISVKVK